MRFIGVLALLTFAACSRSEPDRQTSHDAAVKVPDARPIADAQVAPDARVAPDAGVAPDARPAKPSKPSKPPPSTLPGRGERCGDGDTCADGLTCLHYYGIAGTRGPRFTSCETPCKGGKGCPAGTTCTVVADGPGQVCR